MNRQQTNGGQEGRSDHIEVKIRLIRPSRHAEDEATPWLITQAIYINGRNIAPKLAIDLRMLAKSCQLHGEFHILTCGCGSLGCAGIEEGIQVTHEEDRITWRMPNPAPSARKESRNTEAAGNPSHYLIHHFQADQYLEAVTQALAKARGLLFGQRQPVECSPYGFEPDDLRVLDPLVFSHRGMPWGYHLTANVIEVNKHRDPGVVYMNGIPYGLRELLVPEAIRKLDDWSDWEPQVTEDGEWYGHCAAPGWEVRRRIKRLGRYLASIQAPGGSVMILEPRRVTGSGLAWQRLLVLEGAWRP